MDQNQINIILDIIKYEYNRRIDFVSDLSEHIEYLNLENIISHNKTSKYSKHLNECVKILLSSYENCLFFLKNKDNQDDENLKLDKKYKDVIKINNINKFFVKNRDLDLGYQKKLLINNIYYRDNCGMINPYFDFLNIDEMIKNKIQIMGGKSLNGIISFYRKIKVEDIENIFHDENDNNLLKILQKLFVPINVTLEIKKKR